MSSNDNRKKESVPEPKEVSNARHHERLAQLRLAQQVDIEGVLTAAGDGRGPIIEAAALRRLERLADSKS